MRNQTPIIITTVLALLFSLTLQVVTAQQVEEKEQIVIKNDIANYTRYGSDQLSNDYIEIYTPLKAFDNLLPSEAVTHTYWSDFGDAGFTIFLKQKLDKAICSAEVLQPTPRNSPFTLTLNSKEFEGVFDSTDKTFVFSECVKDVSQIKLDVKAEGKWTTLSEIKLFANKITPPIEPPICPENTYYDAEQKKCVNNIPSPVNETLLITNSTVNFDITNSTMKIKADSISTITIDVNDANVTTTNSNTTNINPQLKTPIGTPLPTESIIEQQQQEAEAEEEEEAAEEEDKDKNKKEEADKK